MTVRDIATVGHPVLRQRAREITPDELASAEIQTLIDDLIDTMHDANGAGIAANQVHEPVRVAVIEVDHNPRYPYKPPIPLTVVVNPVLEPLDDELVEINEGCLSVPNLRGNVFRHVNVRVRYLDRDGVAHDEIKRGLTAGTFQHECDHLDGLLFLDRVVDTTTLTTWEQFERFHRDAFVARHHRLRPEGGQLAGVASRPPERLLQVPFPGGLVRLEVDVEADMVPDHARRGRQLLGGKPVIGRPQLGPPQRLGAVHVRLVDRHDDRDPRRLPVDGNAPAQVGIRDELGGAVDAQCLVEAGDEEQQRNVRIGHEVLERVEAVVARQVGPRQSVFVENLHEPRRSTLGRSVAHAVGIGGRQHEERRLGDEVRAVDIEVVDHLLDRVGTRRAVVLA